MALLRADLPSLLPDRWEQVDAQLVSLLSAQESAAGRSVEEVLRPYPALASRRRSYLQSLTYVDETGVVTRGDDRPAQVPGSASQFAPLAGDMGRPRRAIWVCPVNRDDPDFARVQRLPGDDMGECPTHHVRLIRSAG